VTYLTFWPDVPLIPIFTHFGLRVRLVDLINCAKFYRNRSIGINFVRCRIWPFLLDCDVANNKGTDCRPTVITVPLYSFIRFLYFRQQCPWNTVNTNTITHVQKLLTYT